MIESPASVSFSTIQMYMPNPCSQSPAVKTSMAFAGKKVTVKQVSRLNIYGLETQVLSTVSNFGHAVWGWDGPKQQAAGGLGRGTPGNTVQPPASRVPSVSPTYLVRKGGHKLPQCMGKLMHVVFSSLPLTPRPFSELSMNVITIWLCSCMAEEQFETEMQGTCR